MALPKLLIATRNPGKLREYRQLLRDVPYDLISLDGLGITEEVEETGSSFAENARLKSSAYAALGGLPALADDSGLEVDALDGAPGVRSARYGEESPMSHRGAGRLSDRDRVALLLRNLRGVPWERRTARFRCVIAVAAPPSPPLVRGGMGRLTLVVGSVAGMIQYDPQGEEGFGYDPVFYLPFYGLTMAQLPPEEKNRISHRADAARKAVKVLKRMYSGQPSDLSN